MGRGRIGRGLHRATLAIAITAAALACGSRTGLDRRPPDGGVDAGPPDAGPPIEPDECIELPFGQGPRELELVFEARIRRADVFFLVDVTGSMGEEIFQIRNELRDTIIPGLAGAIPEVRFGVGHFADFPIPERNYGEATDELYRVLQASTRDRAAVQDAVNRLPLQNGRDGPEAMVEALYLTASGEGMGRFAPAASCPSGTRGHPCFALDATPIVLTFSDAPSHNGPNGHDPYEGIEPTPHTYEQAVEALRAIGARVLGLYSGGGGGVGLSDLESFARDTGAVREDRSPIVFDIGVDGRFLSRAVVDAVRALVEDTPIDVDVELEDLPGDDGDALALVDRVEAVRAEPPEGARMEGSRFVDVRPGTRLVFRIVLDSEVLDDEVTRPGDVPQSYLLRVTLRGDGVARLEERAYRIVVPSRDGAGCPRD